MWLVTAVVLAALSAPGTRGSYMDFLSGGNWLTKYDFMLKPICCTYYSDCLLQDVNRKVPCPSLPRDITNICQKIFSRDKRCSQRRLTFNRGAPARRSPCLLPAEPGPCKMRLPRFVFQVTSGQCVPFTYGGCLGNGNNFMTQAQCQETCADGRTDSSVANPAVGHSQRLTAGRCSQPLETGLCKMSIPRFGFDVTSGRCIRFVYGGCRGNDNNFSSLGKCQEICSNMADRAR